MIKNSERGVCMPKKKNKQYQKQNSWIGGEYVIRYCSEERFVVLSACSFICVCDIILSISFFITHNSFFSFFLLLLAVPAVLAMLYISRFRIRIQMERKLLEIRKLSGKSGEISPDEIQEIYYSTDGKVKFLNIVTESANIHVNTSACENVQFLELFLNIYCEHKFKTGVRKEKHLL